MMARYRWVLGVCGLLLLSAVGRADDERDVQALADAIDHMLGLTMAAEKIQPAPPADDAEFMRRAYCDLAGRIPSVAEARAFLDQRSPDKRRALIGELLSGADYVNHFTNYWRRLLAPDAPAGEDAPSFAGLNDWLRKQLATNRPYDQFVREIVTFSFATKRARQVLSDTAETAASPAGYFLSKDIKAENLAASTAQQFLGIRLECAQCHNHPFASWKREQFWGYAAFFAGLQRQNVQEEGVSTQIREVFDRREMAIPGSSQVVAAKFLDGRAPQWRYKVGPRVTLADWMTAADNPYFARAAANRMFGYLLGTGLVDPVDDLGGQHPPSHPELLDELARQFAVHGFDWKFLIRAITASQAYQRSSMTSHSSQNVPRRYARMAVRGLTGEQIFDSLVMATRYQEPRQPKLQPGQRSGSGARREFLLRFTNNQADNPTEAQTSILQALALMNGRFIADITSPTGKGTLAVLVSDDSQSTAQRIETLFLAALSRRPGTEESERLVKYVDGGGANGDAKKALADVFWALLNSGEFILNH